MFDCVNSTDVTPSLQSHSQGWLTVSSAPFRPNPDSVTVDRKQQLPWLHSLCVSVYPRNGLTHPEGKTSVRVFMCVCARVFVYACVWERELQPWIECTELREEPACQVVWCHEGRRWWGGGGGEKLGTPPSSHRRHMSLNCQLSTVPQECVYVCVIV